MTKKLTKEVFEERSRVVHPCSDYDYSEVIYINNNTKVNIICNKQDHGVFSQVPSSHLFGNGCPNCAQDSRNLKRTFTHEEALALCRKVHGDRYSYDKMVYKNYNTPITITCPSHGDFKQYPSVHLCRKGGCPKCVGHLHKDLDYIKSKCIAKHNNKYTYEKMEEINTIKDSVTITCSLHGDFRQSLEGHLNGKGCFHCGLITIGNLKRKPFTVHVQDYNRVHNNKYIYPEQEYKNSKTSIRILCPDHGEFLQVASCHKSGDGCPNCAHPVSREHQKVINLLSDLGYKEEEDFLVNDWKVLGRFQLDIYFPKFNLGIEVDGLYWHGRGKTSEKVFGREGINKALSRDSRKDILCEKKKVNLIRFTDLEVNKNISFVKEKLLETIKSLSSKLLVLGKKPLGL